MVKITRNVAIRETHKIESIDMGVFFEFESKLYIALKAVGPGKSDIRCYNVNDAISADLDWDSDVYLCNYVKIKYDLFDPEGA